LFSTPIWPSAISVRRCGDSAPTLEPRRPQATILMNDSSAARAARLSSCQRRPASST
jgi:hypothetical protein